MSNNSLPRLHDGCFSCGSDEQEILSSRTTTIINRKGLREIKSVAVCETCWENKSELTQVK